MVYLDSDVHGVSIVPLPEPQVLTESSLKSLGEF